MYIRSGLGRTEGCNSTQHMNFRKCQCNYLSWPRWSGPVSLSELEAGAQGRVLDRLFLDLIWHLTGCSKALLVTFVAMLTAIALLLVWRSVGLFSSPAGDVPATIYDEIEWGEETIHRRTWCSDPPWKWVWTYFHGSFRFLSAACLLDDLPRQACIAKEG